MARKENEKEADRPHYYSQFWLDVAAGRRIIGAPKENEGDVLEPDISDAVPTRRAASSVHDGNDYQHNTDSNGRVDNIAHPVVDTVVPSDDDIVEPDALEFTEPDDEELDLRNDEVAEDDIPDILDEEDEDNLFEEEEEEEEEEDWGRGRKKPSPKRPTKQPNKKQTRPRRGGF